MELADLMTFINQSGFPVIVSLYTLTRMEKTIQQNTETVATLVTAIEVLKKGDN